MGTRGDSRLVIGIVNFGLRCDLGRHLESEKVRERASFADRRGDRFPKLGIAALVPSQGCGAPSKVARLRATTRILRDSSTPFGVTINATVRDRRYKGDCRERGIAAAEAA